MKRRIFVAIPIPEDVGREINRWQKRHGMWNIRWIQPRNLHITLVPPWYVTDDELAPVVKIIASATTDFAPFAVAFINVLFGPPGQPPRLIWAEGNCLPSGETRGAFRFSEIAPSAGNSAERPRGASKFPRGSPRGRNGNEGKTPPEFVMLKAAIEQALLDGRQQTGFLKKEGRQPKLHLTIARFRPGTFRKIPELDEKVSWGFEVNEIHLMESVLKNSGAEYTALQKFKMQKSKLNRFAMI